MTKIHSKSLEHYAHKTLIKRLLFMTLAIVIIVGGMAFVFENRRMQNYVLEQAENAVELMVVRARIIKAEKKIDGYSAFRQALAERLANPVDRQSGEFIYAGFFKPDDEVIDEFIDKESLVAEKLKNQFVKSPLLKLTDGAQITESIDLDGESYIYVVFPVMDLQNKVAAYTHAIFSLSDAIEERIRNSILRAVIMAILIVLATSLLLYPVILRLVKRLTLFSANLLDANLQSISLLGGTIAKRDSDTDAHNYRVSIYSVKLAEAVGLDVETIRRLIKGAFLHDVGKIGIRDNILLKPAKLDNEEFAVMKKHVEHGLDIVDRSAWLADAKDVVGGHHEKFAGGGYPDDLQGKDIPIVARIFAIADVFDALTSKRPYKKPMSFEKTMAILDEGSNTHFDPDLIETFKKIAPALYKEYCGREDDGLHEELDAILQHYFATDVQSMITSMQ